MKIKITHSTTYKYNSTVPRLIQCLKLYPSICDNQEIIEWKTFSNNGKILESHTDALGHRIQNIFINNFHGQLKITSKGILKTKDLSGVVKGLKEKKLIISRHNAYHGSTYLSASCSGKERDKNNFDFADNLVHHLSSPDPFRKDSNLSDEEFCNLKVQELEDKIYGEMEKFY